MLHEGRSETDQYTQDTRLTAIVRKYKEIIWRLIVTSARTVNYTLKISPAASFKPPEAVPVSTRTDLAIVDDVNQEDIHHM